MSSHFSDKCSVISGYDTRRNCQTQRKKWFLCLGLGQLGGSCIKKENLLSA